jgi:hypothetical protein
MKVAVCGPRWVQKIDLESVLPEATSTIVSGGARGVDTLAENFARQRGLKTIIHYPDYKRYGRRAPLVRNSLIVEDADQVIAFWDGVSRGTHDTIKKAERKGKPVLIVSVEVGRNDE